MSLNIVKFDQIDSLAISQSLIPQIDDSFDIGSSSKQWRDIYVSSGILYINNKKLSTIDNNGTASIVFDNKTILLGESGSLPNTSSYALTASYALNASQGGTTLVTGSTYPITSSWSNNSISSSYALTASFASNSGTSLVTGSTYPITSSWSNNSVSSSYALTASFVAGGGGTTLTTGSTYPITSSWANNVISSITASYLVPTNNYIVNNFTASNISASGNIRCVSLTETSTIEAKTNIVSLTNELNKVLQLNPVSFTYKSNNEQSIGLIAEELNKIYPEFTSENADAVSYGKITSVLIQSIKELKFTIDDLQQQINYLKK